MAKLVTFGLTALFKKIFLELRWFGGEGGGGFSKVLR